MSTVRDRRQRAPNGVLTAKPIALRLKADERARVEKYSSNDQRSLASFSRVLCLAGLAVYEHWKTNVPGHHFDCFLAHLQELIDRVERVNAIPIVSSSIYRN